MAASWSRLDGVLSWRRCLGCLGALDNSGRGTQGGHRIGQEVTVIDPDFEDKKWIGFRGKIQDNPFLDICRSQVDVTIEGDCAKLAEDMRGFHWMLAYGDHLKETGYALNKLGVGRYNLSDEREIEA